MDTCYSQELIMPISYVALNEEEMIYLEGGDYIVDHWPGCFTRVCTSDDTAKAIATDLENAADIAGVAGTLGVFIDPAFGVAWLGNIYYNRIARKIRDVITYSVGCKIKYTLGYVSVSKR